MKYSFRDMVFRVEERFIDRHVTGAGALAKFIPVSIGWFISLKGSQISICVGEQKPELIPGDDVKFSIEKL